MEIWTIGFKLYIQIMFVSEPRYDTYKRKTIIQATLYSGNVLLSKFFQIGAIPEKNQCSHKKHQVSINLPRGNQILLRYGKKTF